MSVPLSPVVAHRHLVAESSKFHSNSESSPFKVKRLSKFSFCNKIYVECTYPLLIVSGILTTGTLPLLGFTYIFFYKWRFQATWCVARLLVPISKSWNSCLCDILAIWNISNSLYLLWWSVISDVISISCWRLRW